MGRASIGAGGRRASHRSAVRMTDEELATVSAAAKRVDVPVSRFLVLAAMDRSRSGLRVRVEVPRRCTPGISSSGPVSDVEPTPVDTLLVFNDAGVEVERLPVAGGDLVDVPVGAAVALGVGGGYLIGHVEPGRIRLGAGWASDDRGAVGSPGADDAREAEFTRQVKARLAQVRRWRAG